MYNKVNRELVTTMMAPPQRPGQLYVLGGA